MFFILVHVGHREFISFVQLTDPPSLAPFSLTHVTHTTQEDFPIRKVLFSAKAEHDSIKNYKIIQQFFTKKGVSSEMVPPPPTCTLSERGGLATFSVEGGASESQRPRWSVW